MSGGWHGWEHSGIAYHVRTDSRRKRPMLYRVDGSVGAPVAYFKDESMARDFLAWLDVMVTSLARKS